MDSDLIKILAGGGVASGALFVLWKLLTPLIQSMVSSQTEFVKNQQIFASALQSVVATTNEMRMDMRASAERAREADEEILAHLRSGENCRYEDPEDDRRDARAVENDDDDEKKPHRDRDPK